MRQLGQIPHPDVTITLFVWNGKILVKLERGPLEQTYKVAEADLPPGPPEAHVRRLLDAEFIADAVARFGQMWAAWSATMERLDSAD